MLCLRTFLKMWVLAPPKVKTEIKQSRLLKGGIKSLGVWRSDPGTPSDKTEKGDRANKLRKSVQEPCVLQMKVKDERRGVFASEARREA